jgi:hypothetical protein
MRVAPSAGLLLPSIGSNPMAVCITRSSSSALGSGGGGVGEHVCLSGTQNCRVRD